MNNLVLKFIVSDSEEVLLRDFLILKGISRRSLTRIKFDEDGFIRVDGKEVTVRYSLTKGQVVEVGLPSEDFAENSNFVKGDLDILYEDDYLLLVNKPADLATIPPREKEDSLLDYLNYYFREKCYRGIPHIVTRLDKDTSGLVLVAKHRHIHASMADSQIDKYYLALAQGKTPERIVIEKKIGLAEDSIIERVISEDGQYAKTLLERLDYNEEKDYSVIKLKLYTGRTHQIRVHCKSIGHSLLGDFLYGGDKRLMQRQALHCQNLRFIHPILNKEINITSPLFEDMENIITVGK